MLKYLDIVDIPFAPDFLNLPPGREPFLLAVVFAQALAIAVGILNFFYAPRWMTEQHQWWWWAFTFLLLDCAQQFPGQVLILVQLSLSLLKKWKFCLPRNPAFSRPRLCAGPLDVPPPYRSRNTPGVAGVAPRTVSCSPAPAPRASTSIQWARSTSTS